MLKENTHRQQHNLEFYTSKIILKSEGEIKTCSNKTWGDLLPSD